MTLLATVGLSSCLAFAQWAGYYYKLIHRSPVEIPLSWMVDGNDQYRLIIEHADSYPAGMTRAMVEIESEEYCKNQN